MRIIACIVFIYGMAASAIGQVRSFQYNNPNVVSLDQKGIELLISNTWHSTSSVTITREGTIDKNFIRTIKYLDDSTFEISGNLADWQLIDNRYLDFRFRVEYATSQLNFGGVYGIKELSDSTLVLEKVLTSNGDSRKIIYFCALKNFEAKWATYQALKPLDKYFYHYGIKRITRNSNENDKIKALFYQGPIDPESLVRIGQLSITELLETGLDVDTFKRISVATKDTIYWIPWTPLKE